MALKHVLFMEIFSVNSLGFSVMSLENDNLLYHFQDSIGLLKIMYFYFLLI